MPWWFGFGWCVSVWIRLVRGDLDFGRCVAVWIRLVRAWRCWLNQNWFWVWMWVGLVDDTTPPLLPPTLRPLGYRSSPLTAKEHRTIAERIFRELRPTPGQLVLGARCHPACWIRSTSPRAPRRVVVCLFQLNYSRLSLPSTSSLLLPTAGCLLPAH